MYRLLCPRLYVPSVWALDLAALRQQGIKGLILDLDNTITPWNSNTITPELAAWVKNTKSHGFALCLLSNNNFPRVQAVAHPLGIPAVARAGKPLKRGFRNALACLGLTAVETAVVGDQLFTDILGGNRLGLYTIWVDPVSRREFIGTKFTRFLERLAIKILATKGLWPKAEVKK